MAPLNTKYIDKTCISGSQMNNAKTVTLLGVFPVHDQGVLIIIIIVKHLSLQMFYYYYHSAIASETRGVLVEVRGKHPVRFR